MNSVLVIAPHPDDETLGCGGTLLKHKARGDSIHWLIVTHISEKEGYSQETVLKRESEIEKVSKLFGFDSTHQLKFPCAKLDTLSRSILISKIGDVFRHLKPHTLFLPNRYDIHSDHRVAFEASFACTKWFRYPFVRRVLMYETISETEFSSALGSSFEPNSFNDVSEFLEKKIDMMKIYASELGEHPFPRSVESIRALATLRGAASGSKAAEAFVLLKEIVI